VNKNKEGRKNWRNTQTSGLVKRVSGGVISLPEVNPAKDSLPVYRNLYIEGEKKEKWFKHNLETKKGIQGKKKNLAGTGKGNKWGKRAKFAVNQPHRVGRGKKRKDPHWQFLG